MVAMAQPDGPEHLDDVARLLEAIGRKDLAEQARREADQRRARETHPTG